MMSSCEQTKEFLHKTQKYVVMKRYGIDIEKRDQIEEWEKEIKKHEQEIEKQIASGLKAAKIYRKIGEAYAGMQMYEPCVEYLDKAIGMGYVSDEILYMQALCQGALARQHNWKEDLRNKAEAGFLKILNTNPDFQRAKIELALLYFYGFGSNSGFSVNSEKISSSQKEYREKAIDLAREYTRKTPGGHDGHIILAGMYSATGKRSEAISELQYAVELLRKNFPSDFQARDDYRQAMINLNRLQGVKGTN